MSGILAADSCHCSLQCRCGPSRTPIASDGAPGFTVQGMESVRHPTNPLGEPCCILTIHDSLELTHALSGDWLQLAEHRGGQKRGLACGMRAHCSCNNPRAHGSTTPESAQALDMCCRTSPLLLARRHLGCMNTIAACVKTSVVVVNITPCAAAGARGASALLPA